MGDVRVLLADYFDILEDNKEAKYLLCKHIPVSYAKFDSEQDLWKIHDNALKNLKVSDVTPELSLFDLKLELAKRIFHNCHFCERRCQVDHSKKIGNCGVKQSGVSSEFLHIGEESVLVPSHTIFFSGCTFHCVFCQNWDISQSAGGIFVQPSKLAGVIKNRMNQGSRNVNWVGGDPTPNVFFILQTLKECDVNLPQVWNSNMYCSEETMRLLDGVIDLYLTDFKYGNDECARRLSKVDKYIEFVERNHKKAYNCGDMIIRHLVLPNHVECCAKPVIRWISKNVPDAVVNIMAQYRPEYHALEYDDISRRVTLEEVSQIKEYAEKLNIHQI